MVYTMSSYLEGCFRWEKIGNLGLCKEKPETILKKKPLMYIWTKLKNVSGFIFNAFISKIKDLWIVNIQERV